MLIDDSEKLLLRLRFEIILLRLLFWQGVGPEKTSLLQSKIVRLGFCVISKELRPEHLHCKLSNKAFWEISKFVNSFILIFKYEICVKSSIPVKSVIPAFETSKESINLIFDVKTCPSDIES